MFSYIDPYTGKKFDGDWDTIVEVSDYLTNKFDEDGATYIEVDIIDGEGKTIFDYAYDCEDSLSYSDHVRSMS